MATKFWTDFSRGLNTDNAQLGDGWAEELHDIVFLRGGEVTQRGSHITRGTFESLGGNPDNVQAWGDHCYSELVGGCLSYTWTTTSPGERLALRKPGQIAPGLSPAKIVDSSNNAISGGTIGVYHAMSQYGDEVVGASAAATVAPFVWAGSTKATYRTGTIATTAGSTTITGTTTLWAANAEAGQYLFIDDSGSGLNRRLFRVVTVTDDTHIVVDRAPDTSVAGKGYSIQALGRLSSPDNIFSSGSAAVNYPAARLICAHQDTVFVADTTEYDSGLHQRHASRLRRAGSVTEGSGIFQGADYWQANAYVDVALGSGSRITALATMGDALVIFKDVGVFVMRGTMASDGTPNGAYISPIPGAAKIGVKSQLSVVQSRIGLVFADEFGVWVYDGASVRSLTFGRVARAWTSLYTPSGAGSFIASALSDRIVFSVAATADGLSAYSGGTSSLVYNFEHDAWYTVTTPNNGGGISRAVYQSAVPISLTTSGGGEVYVTNSSSGIGILEIYDFFSDIYWVGNAAVDGWKTTSPKLSVVTPPISPLPAQHSTPTAVWIFSQIADLTTLNPTITLSVVPGMSGASSRYQGWGPPLWTEIVGPSVAAETTYDDWQRSSIGAGTQGACPGFRLKATLTTGGKSSDVRIYGLGVEYDEVPS